ncbi:MAG: methylated-DNA--[protein]-cysteine S-methyltransferase [Gloeobacterales cyanobacterium]
MMEFQIDKIDSEIGTMVIVSDGEYLCALDFADYESRMLKLLQKRFGTITFIQKANPQGFSERVRAYLAGEYRAVEHIPVATGGTPFQQSVWAALRKISPGTTISYGELAKKLGNPQASRAVGMANSLNPIAIVLPCHRVIGAHASLTGYAGGIDRKRWLLKHEGVTLAKFA